jgi:hypothetical protein
MIVTDETIETGGMIVNEEMIEGLIETPGLILDGIQETQGTRLLAILPHPTQDNQAMIVMITLPQPNRTIVVQDILPLPTLLWILIIHNIQANTRLLILHSMEAAKCLNIHLLEIQGLYLRPDTRLQQLVMPNLDIRTQELQEPLMPQDILHLLLKVCHLRNRGTFYRNSTIWFYELTFISSTHYLASDGKCKCHSRSESNRC